MRQTIRAENKDEIVEAWATPPLSEAELRALLLAALGCTATDASEALA